MIQKLDVTATSVNATSTVKVGLSSIRVGDVTRLATSVRGTGTPCDQIHPIKSPIAWGTELSANQLRHRSQSHRSSPHPPHRSSGPPAVGRHCSSNTKRGAATGQSLGQSHGHWDHRYCIPFDNLKMRDFSSPLNPAAYRMYLNFL